MIVGSSLWSRFFVAGFIHWFVMSRRKLPAKRRTSLKYRIFDRDQIIEQVKKGIKPELDEELPGDGRFYCSTCCRHFETTEAMKCHMKGSPHKRAVKALLLESEEPWTQQAAEAVAGLMPERIRQSGPINNKMVTDLMIKDSEETKA
eukprot:Protomagalhaensia_sp_Gyna_25__3824@NODE_3437_length_577_cov_26_585502_g2891_i0_p1_GENE_NODE_3437_length_577_cov_26_585502_g2891_i0NODE_3437_length_577_cov_26_585502_g2891_i0_p1_ORF_typecomplete_len147_score23_18Spt46/PF17734_1/0_00055zfC2H2_2/PF12756_7/0_00066zfC2H2_jaz/PF12171_8/0_00094zfU1/PF06220_12/0_01zfC2H2_aberr/PF17017_5/0_031Metallothio_Pro/PF02069_16/0_071DUF4764/PF15961_5/0_064Actin_micro/PF17003_5/0_15zfmet/PF12874_7/0_28_NODE_3437_length_577_cov_26_585502_g2891_i062502